MKVQASSIYRNIKCSGSAHLENNIPREKQYNAFKDAAKFGSTIHNVAEIHLREKIAKQKGLTLKTKLKNAGFDVGSFDYDRAYNAIDKYVKYVAKVCRQRKPLTVEIEKKYRFDFKGVDLVFKCDCLSGVYNKDEIIIDIFDLKTGNYNYFESASWQMLFSVLVYIAKLLPKDLTQTIETHIHVVQPNFWKDSEKVMTTKYNFVNIHEAITLLYDTIIGIKEEPDFFSPGDWCRMCPGILHCPEGQSSISIIKEVANVYSVDISQLTPVQLESIYSRKEFIETFLKSVEQQILTDLENGVTYENVNIKTTKGHRKWVDPKQTEKVLLKKIGADIYEPKKLKSVAQMEKITGKKNIEGLYDQADIKKINIIKNPFKAIE